MISLILLLACGFSVSFILYRDSSEKVASYRDLYEICRIVEDRIRCERAPLTEIFDGLAPDLRRRLGEYRAVGAAESLSRVVPTGGDEVFRLAEGIASGDYDSALSFAGLLKKHTEKEMQRVAEESKRGAKARAYLPVAASLLAALLLI